MGAPDDELPEATLADEDVAPADEPWDMPPALDALDDAEDTDDAPDDADDAEDTGDAEDAPLPADELRFPDELVPAELAPPDELLLLDEPLPPDELLLDEPVVRCGQAASAVANSTVARVLVGEAPMCVLTDQQTRCRTRW